MTGHVAIMNREEQKQPGAVWIGLGAARYFIIEN